MVILFWKYFFLLLNLLMLILEGLFVRIGKGFMFLEFLLCNCFRWFFGIFELVLKKIIIIIIIEYYKKINIFF